MQPGSRTKALTALTIALVFVAGGAAGYALSVREGDAAEPPPPAHRGYVYELFDPNAQQRARIDSIMQVHRHRMGELNAEFDVIRLEYRAATDSLSRATTDAIARVFPPDVAAEYRERLAERRAESARERAKEEAEDTGQGDGR